MLIHLKQVLDPESLEKCRATLEQADWSDGRGSAGYLSRAVKRNRQLPDDHPAARELGEKIVRILDGNQQFTAAALPAKIVPPLFNCYEEDNSYGRHVDGAIRPVFGTPHRVRTDISATLFLSEPDSYSGGELIMEDTYGPVEVKLPAGDMVLYPGSSVHAVKPVTSGRRLAAFFWIQSMVRGDHRRSILYELDKAIQRIATETPEQEALVDLAGVYHNLLREWADP
ncbi:MAG: Fe2+-dependent dioxygenase [Gammaproteobacteria bacterium]|nr:Fe2+-dependent dioxygenase [Gammaproteobacteria bacterium]MYF01204.1 Fe2+-dependent dioxygenase [Gammaproteobacteria bacterium]MYH45193.1 Fe2+-dependent dioxygenase [Gammaproteobacteria bacterium]MYL12431.1 Fe2+-dependent dioxygenase [Gammaproteobacteria bacterium]